MIASQDARRRLIDAMEIGPRWLLRETASPPAPMDADRPARIARLDWITLQETVATCRACVLCETRTRTVFGVGSERPSWLVIGAAPDADADAIGEPFVGKAGKLLDAMLASIGLSRGRDVHIANVVRCRPPGDRDPSPDEIAQCRPFLDRQVALLAPEAILVLGEVAGRALLGTDASMQSLRGRAHRIESAGRPIPVVATYHPADLLRTPEDKHAAWIDLCLAREIHERQAGLEPA